MALVNIWTIAFATALVGLTACSNNSVTLGKAESPQDPQILPVQAQARGMEGRQQGQGRDRRGEAALVSTQALTAPSDIDRCAVVKASVEEAGFSDSVKVSCGGDHAFLTSNTMPDHPVLTGIALTNEQTVVPVEGLRQQVLLAPVLSDTPQTRDSSLAVAVNGVPIFDYTGGGEMSQDDLYHYQSRHDTLTTKQLDICGGHAGRGDDYHYHVSPTCMIEMMNNKDEDDAIIAWAFDGFPIYRNKNPDGTIIEPGELDVCNGKADSTFGYRYHTSQTAPYIIQCIMGEIVSIQSLPRARGLRPAEGSARKPTGRPVRGGVDELVFTARENGVKSLDYTYRGKPYYIRYSDSDTPGCYEFNTRTVTDGGAPYEGELCR